jgi:hypothetical protein
MNGLFFESHRVLQAIGSVGSIGPADKAIGAWCRRNPKPDKKNDA